MITEDFVSFEIAKLLREKGFNENCDRSYVGDDAQELSWSQGFNNSYYKEFYKDINIYSAPRISFVMKWLREVHNIFIGISVCERYENLMDYETKVMFFFELLNLKEKQIIDGYSQEYVHTYKDACESAIKYCLENLI